MDTSKPSKLFQVVAAASLLVAPGIYAGDIYMSHPTIQVNFVNGNAVINQTHNQYRNVNRGPIVLHEDYNTYHLGDENFRGRRWRRLYGQCYFIRFQDNGTPGNYYLSLARFGTESAAVFLNRIPVGYLPKQYGRRGRRPNFWSGQEWISLQGNLIYRGNNTLAICSSPVPRPEFPGDVDDFQIRNIKLIKN